MPIHVPQRPVDAEAQRRIFDLMRGRLNQAIEAKEKANGIVLHRIHALLGEQVTVQQIVNEAEALNRTIARDRAKLRLNRLLPEQERTKLRFEIEHADLILAALQSTLSTLHEIGVSVPSPRLDEVEGILGRGERVASDARAGNGICEARAPERIPRGTPNAVVESRAMELFPAAWQAFLDSNRGRTPFERGQPLVGFCFDLRRGIGGFGLTEREQDAVTAFLRRLENENAPKLSDSDLVCIEQAYVRFRLMQRIIYNPGRYQ